MADIAQSAVLVSSTASTAAVAQLPTVEGPRGPFFSAASVMSCYPHLGFQASHYAHAVALAKKMVLLQEPSKVYQMQEGAYVLVSAEGEADTLPVFPTLFMGITANLLGTGCREALRFLLQEGLEPRLGQGEAEDVQALPDDQLFFHQARQGLQGTRPPLPSAYQSFLRAVVVSGGGLEHDLRRACCAYTFTDYASEAAGPSPEAGGAAPAPDHVTFGNVSYPRHCPLFDLVLEKLVRRLADRQEALQAAAAAAPVPEAYLDVCTWAVSPSEVWALAGLWLVDLLAEALEELKGGAGAAVAAEALERARTTCLYWAAVQQVPLFSPSFVDGDVMHVVARLAPSLQLDLVRDVHRINKLAMQSKKAGMLICGGGVVKHHVCNANLMRNGADYTIILNNGQEFDGSDGGARPEEALSWGKIRLEGEYVKVYGEVTTTFPLLVAEAFVPAVRERDQ